MRMHEKAAVSRTTTRTVSDGGTTQTIIVKTAFHAPVGVDMSVPTRKLDRRRK